jgi:branched-chain amino acid transport system permease protein
LIWQQLLNGLTLGSTYALIALGYTMVYGIIQLINFAHGEIYMIGAFVGLFLVVNTGLNIGVALLGAMAFCMVLGMLVELIAYRPLRGRASRLSGIISAIGVSIYLHNHKTNRLMQMRIHHQKMLYYTAYLQALLKLAWIQAI